MLKIEADYIVTMREALNRLFNELGRYSQEEGFRPKPGSQADTEMASFVHPESIVTGISMALHLIESGGEHVTAFVKTVTEPMEPIACWTCVRSILESCALTSWLLDPSIDAQTRVGRILGLRYEGMEQRLKFGSAAGDSQAELKSLSDRINEVERHAVSLGYAEVKDRKGKKRIGIGQKMPGATDIIQMMLGEEVQYRLLSAVAHGHYWAINQLGFAPVTAPSAVGTVAVHTFEKQPNFKGIALLGMLAAKSISRAVWNEARYFGWDQAKLVKILEEAFDSLQAKPVVRFWR